jgi:hypothetical protein
MDKMGQCRAPTTGTVAAVIGHDQVEPVLGVKRRYVIVVANNLAVSMKEDDPRPAIMAGIEAACDGYTIIDMDCLVKGIARRTNVGVTRIKDVIYSR